MNDLIDRRAAIDAVKNTDVVVLYHDTEPVEEAIEEAIEATKRSITTGIEGLPSAQPGLPDLPEWAKKVEYHDPFGNPIYVYVRVNDKTVTIKADDLQKALDYVTEHGEEVTIEGRRTDEPDR